MNLVNFLLVLICILLVSGFVLYYFQDKFIFINGKKIHKSKPYQFANTFKEVFIETSNNNEINALHFTLSNPKGIVLFCHGNKGNLSKWGHRVSYLLAYNYEVLVFDYRSYGKSTGNFNEEGMYADAEAVYNSIKKQYKEENIVVYGYSLGGTFATRIASQNTPKELVLEAPFYNLKKAVQYYSRIAPTFLLKYAFRTDKDIVNVTAPITLFHGNQDKTTSFRQSKDLLKRNPSIQNQFIEVDTGTHHNLRDFSVYKDKLKEVLVR
jgi:alpha-beta hydrolase superfamily lysophospholipase